MISPVDVNKPCLVLAPSLEYPLRNGGDIYIDRKWAAFSCFVPHVDIITKHSIVRYRNGELIDRKTYNNRARSKLVAGLLALLKQGHYLAEKFLTREFVETASSYLRNPDYGIAVFSYITTSSILDSITDVPARENFIETHNDEFKWFRNFINTKSSWPVRKISQYAINWLEQYMASHTGDFTLINVTKDDYDGFQNACPGYQSIISHVGVDIRPINERHHPSKKIRLIFVGSLSTQMNIDALFYFADHFYPTLQDNLFDTLSVTITGSKPDPKIIDICKRNGWTLVSNPSESELDSLYEYADFAILPFQYTTGSKLKLLETLAHGTPFLATNHVTESSLKNIPYCLCSDNPAEWLAHLQTHHTDKPDVNVRRQIICSVEPYSWGNIARQLYSDIQALSQHPA